MHSLSAEGWLQPVKKAGIRDRDRLGLKHAAWEGVRLDVRCSYIYADVHCGGFGTPRSSDEPLENKHFLCFQPEMLTQTAGKQRILPKPKLNQESNSEYFTK